MRDLAAVRLLFEYDLSVFQCLSEDILGDEITPLTSSDNSVS